MFFKTVVKLFVLILALQLTLNAREINIDKIINEAKLTNKHLFVWLHRTNCGYCENMKEFTLQNDSIKSFIDKHFIFVHININEKDNIVYREFSGNGREFAQELGYDFYPTSLFFDYDGEIIYAEVGYIDTKEYSNEQKFDKVLNFIQSKSYEKIKYKDYKYMMREEL